MTPLTVEQLYREQVSQRPAAEQLRLLTLVADGLAAGLPEHDDWTDADLEAVTLASLRQFEAEEGPYGD